MKKVAGIIAVALMTLGLTTYAVENSSNELDFTSDSSTMLACDGCHAPTDDRQE